VLESAIRSQVNEGAVTYKAGQGFSELPGGRHGVSPNASRSKPAKLVAELVVDTNETDQTILFETRGWPPLVVPASAAPIECGQFPQCFARSHVRIAGLSS
jgi:hypothetical protein